MRHEGLSSPQCYHHWAQSTAGPACRLQLHIQTTPAAPVRKPPNWWTEPHFLSRDRAVIPIQRFARGICSDGQPVFGSHYPQPPSRECSFIYVLSCQLGDIDILSEHQSRVSESCPDKCPGGFLIRGWRWWLLLACSRQYHLRSLGSFCRGGRAITAFGGLFLKFLHEYSVFCGYCLTLPVSLMSAHHFP